MTMMEEYFNTRDRYLNEYGNKTFLLWQNGSFLEVYAKEHDMENIIEFSKICNIRISNSDRSSKIMAGFNPDQLQKYLPLLIEAGYTIVVYHEVPDITKGKNGKKRELLCIESPGISIIENNTITNYCSCVWIEKYNKDHFNKLPYFYCGVSVIDNYTGKSIFYQYKYTNNNIHNTTAFDELDRFMSIYNPSESIIIHNYNHYNIKDIVEFASINSSNIHYINVTEDNEKTNWVKNAENINYQKEIFNKFFKINDYNVFLKSLMLEDNKYATNSYCFLLEFCHKHNPSLTNKIALPKYEKNNDSVYLATHCLKQLNIINTHQSNNTSTSSVLNLINKCKTTMGTRRFAHKLLHPSINVEFLKKEYDIIEYVNDNFDIIDEVRKNLYTIRDIEKLYRRIHLYRINTIDICNLYDDLNTIINIKKEVDNYDTFKDYLFENLNSDLKTELNSLKDFLKKTFDFANCHTYANNYNKDCINIFNREIYPTLDKAYRDYLNEIDKLNVLRKYMIDLACQLEKSKKFNKDLYIKINHTDKGLNLEMTSRRFNFLNMQIKKIIEKEGKLVDFTYKSSYDNSDITFKFDISSIKGVGKSQREDASKKLEGSALKSIYKKILQRKENVNELIKGYFKDTVQKISKYNIEFNNIVEYVSLIDIVLNKSYVSKKFNYCKPTIEDGEDSYCHLFDMRHPLIEQLQDDEIYVPNDVHLGVENNGILLYGTNAVGKSSLIKSIGVNIIMAQAGMYVSCNKLIFSPYKSIFTRILGNDNIFKGLSTFAVEMCELRTILNNCDKNSLILGDELCSGTEIQSALAIFTCGLRYFDKSDASYIFATHFHQLKYDKSVLKLIENKRLNMNHMSVEYDKSKDLLVWKRKLLDGPGDDMYGLEVCKALNLPDGFVDEAFEIRNFNIKNKSILEQKKSSYNKSKIKGKCAFCNKDGVDVHHLNPQEFADENKFIKHFHKNKKANLVNICAECHEYRTKNKIVERKTKTSQGYVYLET